MTNPPPLALTIRPPIEAPDDDWVVSLSLRQASRVLPSRVRWAERGSLRAFFKGLLYDRDELADATSRCDLSDAELVLRVYDRGGEVALSRLRGSFVVAIIDDAPASLL